MGHFSGNATVGATSAFTAEAAAPAIIKAMGWDKDSLTEKQKQTVSALATLAAGLAGGLVGDSSSSAVAGAQAGKNAVENNSMSGLVPPRVQQDASLAFDPSQKGKSAEQINEAIDASHLGPSWGTEYKVKPYVKGEVAGGAGADYYFDTSIDPYQISANRGETLAIGGRISGQIGIQFGPYFPGTIDSERNSSVGLGLGVISSEISYGKDGFSFGAGPAWGWSGVSTNAAGEKNGYQWFLWN